MVATSSISGPRPSRGDVPGSRPRVVDLLGTSMSALTQAIPVIAERTGRRVIVIGGLAVVCRLSRPYRATIDLDTVNRRRALEPAMLEVLLASGAQASGPAGALVPTDAGPVQVDVLEVTDAELASLPDDPGDRLHVLAHAWAAASSSPVMLRTDSAELLEVAMAEPGPLIAMKLQSVANRPQAKEATDLLDIVSLTLDTATGPASRSALATANPTLRRDALLHARMWFEDRIDRSLRLIRSIPEGRDTQLDDLRFVGELLHDTLEP